MAVPPLVALALMAEVAATAPTAMTSDQTHLRLLEVESHQRWLQRDVAALARIMDEEFHFVAMNGAVETRAEILGSGDPAGRTAPPPLAVRTLTVEPEQVIVRDRTGIVISTMQIDATVRGRPLAPEMRVLSIFTRSGEDWILLARSITPVRRQPAE